MKNKRKKLILLLLTVFSVGIIFTNSKAQAYSKVDESQIYYANATLTKINPEQYNSKIRGMTTGEYWNHSYEERISIDRKYMLFGGTGVPGVSTFCCYDPPNQNAESLTQGLASEYLVNNNLRISRFNNGESFFPTQSYANSNPQLYWEILRDWKFPFKKESNGYYTFNSNDYVVQRNYTEKKLELHQGNHYCFYPFNNIGDDCSNVNVRQYYFTMRLDIPYTMTSDGKISGQDMIFNFAGDDDVWVYVDGKLAVDIGGCHSLARANLNFASNSVQYDSSENFSAKTVYNVLNEEQKKAGQHTLTLFYMDRADGEANCIASFNMQRGGIKTNYIDKNNNNVLSSNTQSAILGKKITTVAKNVEGYTLIQSPEKEEYTITDKLQEVNYYYAKKTQVKVKYVDTNTNKEIDTTTNIEGYEGKDYETKQKEITDYIFLRSSGTVKGKMPREESTVTFYYAKKTQVKVKYIDTNTNKEIDTATNIEGYEGKDYETKEKEITDYIFLRSSGTVKGKMPREESTVIFYYAKKTQVNVSYLEKDTNMVLDNDILEGYEGKDYETKQKNIANYTMVENSANTKGRMTKDIINVYYYYLQQTSFEVNYIDKATGDILKTRLYEGLVGQSIQTSAEQIDGYTLIQSPITEKYNLTKEKQIVNYYYAKNTNVIVKYLDKKTGNKLVADIVINGYEGKEYKSQTKEFENYTLSGISGKTTGKMQREEITITYQYLYNGSLTIQYIDKSTDKILKNEEMKGLEGEVIVTKPKEIPGYILVEKPKIEKVEITRELQTIKYYYSAISKGVVEKHINYLNDYLLEEEIIHEGKEGDQYSVLPKQFDNYELVKEKLPDNSSGLMGRELIEVKYYYIKKCDVTVNYIDKITNKVIETYKIQGRQFEVYQAERKDFINYKLDEENLPRNEKGVLQDKEILVNYYYIPKAESITVNYIDKITGKIMEKVLIKGFEGDTYISYPKEIEKYKLDKTTIPANASGKMTNKPIIVNYYYVKESSICVNYIDSISEEIIKSKVIQGLEKEEYTTEAVSFLNYELLQERLPKNGTGIFTNSIQEVNYYYIYKSTLTIKYIDREISKILDKEVIQRYETDTIQLEDRQIEGYHMVEKPEMKEITFTKENKELNYYYEKDKLIVADDKEKTEEKKENKDKILPKTGLDNFKYMSITGIVILTTVGITIVVLKRKFEN